MEILTYFEIEVKIVIKLNLNLLQVHLFLGVRPISVSVKHILYIFLLAFLIEKLSCLSCPLYNRLIYYFLLK